AADDPRLTVRLAPGASPTRIVVDSTLRLPLDAGLLADGAAPTLVATTPRAPQSRVDRLRGQGVEGLHAGVDAVGRVDLADLLQRLAGRRIESLLIEGGRGIITSALGGRLVDRLVVCIAPKVLGTGIDAVGNLGIGHLRDALTFARSSFTALGEDVIFDGE